MKVLTFGALNIDYVYTVDHFVMKGETQSAEELNVYAGGKGLNQSVALARAGIEVYHAGAIGKDGIFLMNLLSESGVNTDYVKVCDDIRSGNAIIQNDKDGDNCILLYGGANQSIEKSQIEEVFSHFTEQDYLLIQNEINNLPYIVECAKKKGMKVILNPSPMNEKVLQLPLWQIDYFILNEVEAFQLIGAECKEDFDGKRLAEQLWKKYPCEGIVLTMGGKGSIYIDSVEYVEQPSYKVKVVDTTAAGDTFTGYFLEGILSGKSKIDSMATAAKAAAIAVSREGAAPAIPDKEEVNHF